MQRRNNFQTISWFYDLYTRKLLNLDPPYQRRSVWNQAYKDYFIDTILLNYPAPAIFLYEEMERTGVAKYHVVDGKQRLLTIFEFISGQYPTGEEIVITELREKYFNELSSDIVTKIWTYTFTVEYLPTVEENTINNIFDRINRNVFRLTSQELRHARLSGVFISEAEDLSDWMFEILSSNFPRIAGKSKKQMKDIELVAQLLLMIEEGAKGYSSEELDKAFSDRDMEWEIKDTATKKFKETIAVFQKMLEIDRDNFLIRSRFRNQADFYSVFGAILQLHRDGKLPEAPIIIEKLKAFDIMLEKEEVRSQDAKIATYYEHTRTASNRTIARKERIQVLTEFLLN